MQQIQDPTAVATLPPPPALTGTVGFFGPAVPGISVATRLRYWYVNMLMMELTNLCALGGVAPDTTGTRFNDVATAVQNMIVNFGFIGQTLTVFRTPGPFSFTVPADVIALDIEMWGGGSGSWASTTSIPGGGGGAGGYVRAAIGGVGPGQVLNGVVGSGGFGGTASSPSSPTNGVNTTFTSGSAGGTLVAAGGIINYLNTTGAPSFGNLGGNGTVFGPNQVIFNGSDGQSGIGTQGGMGGAAAMGGGSTNSGTTGRAGYWPGGGASGAGCPGGVHYDGAAGANGLVLIRC